DVPIEELQRELGLTEPLFETIFDPISADGGELGEDIVLRVSIVEGDGVVVRLRYRTDAVDTSYAARIAGYHITALTLIAADEDGEHARQSLLSNEESHIQLHALRGPHREDAFPGRLQARAHGARQHDGARPRARVSARSPDAPPRRRPRREPCRRRSRRQGYCEPARLHLLHLRLHR